MKNLALINVTVNDIRFILNVVFIMAIVTTNLVCWLVARFADQ